MGPKWPGWSGWRVRSGLVEVVWLKWVEGPISARHRDSELWRQLFSPKDCLTHLSRLEWVESQVGRKNRESSFTTIFYAVDVWPTSTCSRKVCGTVWSLCSSYPSAAWPIATVTSIFLSAFECESWDPSGEVKYDTMRLSIHMEIDCETEAHGNWMLVSVMGIVFYSFGIPCLYWLKLRRIYHCCQEPLQHPRSLRKFGCMPCCFQTCPEQNRLNMYTNTFLEHTEHTTRLYAKYTGYYTCIYIYIYSLYISFM